MAAYGHASPLDQELGLKATPYYPMLPQTLSSFEIVPSGLSLEYLTGMTDERPAGPARQLLASLIIKTPDMHFLIHSMAIPSYIL